MAPLLLLFCMSSAYADVNGDLGNFFNSLGYDGNITQSHAYQGQEAGYYSGGSMFLRNQIRDVQVMHVDLPSFSGGCAGIDAYLGGFSFINSDQIVALTKKIMSNATGYMFDLALETTVPELKSVKDYIQKISNEINNLNVNSCNAAQDLVGGMWPKTQASQQQVCKDVGTQNNKFADWAAARQGCGVGGKFNDQMNAASTDPAYKKEVVVNKNLIWDSLKNNGFFNDDHELMEFFMSLSGTIIFDSKGKATYVPSLAGNHNLIKAFLYGGEATLWTCGDTDKCLTLSKGKLEIDQNKSLVNNVSNTIMTIIQSVQTDSGISDAEKGFVNSTSIPILKFVTVLSSLKMNAQAMDLTQYSEVIAEDILAQYLTENLNIVEQSLKTNDFTPDIQHSLSKKISNAEQQVVHMQTKAYQKLQDTMALVRNMQFLEGQLSANLTSSLKQNNQFGG
jgi:conjugative transfer pilus assembly protein TraH